MDLRYVSNIQDGIITTSDVPVKQFYYRHDGELVALVSRLIEQGYSFVDAPAGWPPASVLQRLQDKGELDVPFTAITWSGPEQYRTYQVPKR